ncbi:hypothetical protein ACFY3O_19315 [Streptomyces sp. NPDC001046]|uniref:hypothetical protein n=1 Tax=Streptomyces sp. NPDC001046 TaxID=3364543 RepID=UPI00368CA857
MQVVPNREVLIVTAAAAVGAALGARWWSARARRPHTVPDVPAADRVEELHEAFRDPTVPPDPADSPAQTLHRYWNHLHPLEFAESPAPTAPHSLLSRSVE